MPAHARCVLRVTDWQRKNVTVSYGMDSCRCNSRSRNRNGIARTSLFGAVLIFLIFFVCVVKPSIHR